MDQNLFVSLALGVGLATAVGFRVFLPLFILGMAIREGIMPVSTGFEWAGSNGALLMFAVAAVVEVIAYYVPLLDNALDAVAAPLAVAAGIGVTALALGDAPPMMKWALAIIAGGGAAAATHGATSLLRGTSTVLTAGIANHVLATGEIASAIGLTLLALALPYLALAVAGIVLIVALRSLWRRRNRAGIERADIL